MYGREHEKRFKFRNWESALQHIPFVVVWFGVRGRREQ